MPRSIYIGSRNQYETIIDDEDYSSIIRFRWTFGISHRHGAFLVYARRSVRVEGVKQTVLMHRYILTHCMGLDCPVGWNGHHKNHDTLDNRRCNLQYLSFAEHARKKLNRKIGVTSCSKHLETTEWRAPSLTDLPF